MLTYFKYELIKTQIHLKHALILDNYTRVCKIILDDKIHINLIILDVQKTCTGNHIHDSDFFSFWKVASETGNIFILHRAYKHLAVVSFTNICMPNV